MPARSASYASLTAHTMNLLPEPLVEENGRGADALAWCGRILRIPFYKRRCQDKCLPATAKLEVFAVQPPVMERDAASFPLPQIHITFVTTPIRSQRRQADGLCKANHSSDME